MFHLDKKRKILVDQYGLPVNMMDMPTTSSISGAVGQSITSLVQAGAPEDKVDAGDSHANYIEIQGTDAGTAPQVKAMGLDTNVNLVLMPKGTGSVTTNNASLIAGSVNVQTNGMSVSTYLNTNNGQSTISNHNTATGNADMVVQCEGTGSVVLGNSTGTRPAVARVTAGTTGTNATLEAIGETNTGLTLATQGSGPVTTASQMKVTNASDTNSNTTGALQVTGGVMVGANLFNGGNCYLNRSSTNFLSLTGATSANSPQILADSLTTTDVSLDLKGKGAGGIHLPTNRNNYFAIDGSTTGSGTVTLAPSVNSADGVVDIILKPKGATGTVRVPRLVGRGFVTGLTQTIGPSTSAVVTLTGISGFPTGVTFDGVNKLTFAGGTTYTKWYVSAYIRYKFDTAGAFVGRCLLYGDPFTSGYFGDYVQTQVSATANELVMKVHGPFVVNTGQGIWFKFFNDNAAGTATVTVGDISLHRLAAD